ncbi:MAG: hypothetical protein V9G29_04395 [Burkholderiaceae bacterium]
MAPTPPRLDAGAARRTFVADLDILDRHRQRAGRRRQRRRRACRSGTLLVEASSSIGAASTASSAHPGFAVMNQNLLAAQGFVGALAPDYDLVKAIREEVIALYNDDAAGLAHVKHVVLLPSVVGLALRDDGVEQLLVSALDLTQGRSTPVSGADIDQRARAPPTRQVHYLGADPTSRPTTTRCSRLRFLRQRPAFKAKVQRDGRHDRASRRRTRWCR